MKEAPFVWLGIVAAIIAGFVWYGLRSSYPQAYNDNFMSSCVSTGSSQARCGCALGVVHSMYKYHEARAFDSSGPPEALKAAVAVQCSNS